METCLSNSYNTRQYYLLTRWLNNNNNNNNNKIKINSNKYSYGFYFHGTIHYKQRHNVLNRRAIWRWNEKKRNKIVMKNVVQTQQDTQAEWNSLPERTIWVVVLCIAAKWQQVNRPLATIWRAILKKGSKMLSDQTTFNC